VKLVTVPEIAAELRLPETTIRRYLKTFHAFIPRPLGQKPLRFRPEVLEIVKLASQGFKAGLGTAEIEDDLSSRFPRVVDTQPIHGLNTSSTDTHIRPFIDEISATIRHGQDDLLEAIRENNRLLARQVQLLEAMAATPPLSLSQNPSSPAAPKTEEAEQEPGFWKKWFGSSFKLTR